MNTLKYNGYLGSVNFSEKDGVFFGKIEGIHGLVNFEGESVKELTDAFHEAVDDYVGYCEAEGGVSINAFIRSTLEQKVAAML